MGGSLGLAGGDFHASGRIRDVNGLQNTRTFMILPFRYETRYTPWHWPGQSTCMSEGFVGYPECNFRIHKPERVIKTNVQAPWRIWALRELASQ